MINQERPMDQLSWVFLFTLNQASQRFMYNLIYCYDAYCAWCYGFSPVMSRFAKDYAKFLSVEVLSGGMIIHQKPLPISVTAKYIRSEYKAVEERTGIRFGEDYLWHVFNPQQSDWFPDSEKPAIAMCIFKELFPDQQPFFAADLQFALHYEGRDLCDDEAYRQLLEKYQIPVDDFYRKLHLEEYRQKALEEFSLVKKLKVSGFPTVLLQESDAKFYLLAEGYTNYDTLKKVTDQVLRQITASSGF
jgi:putative protein-disulfide isomerase